jgi:hypothetical protein
MTLDHTATTISFDCIVSTMTFDAIVAFDIPLVALLTSTPVMWREEHLLKL